MTSSLICGYFNYKCYSRQVNHIVTYLDKCTVFDRILSDDATVVRYLDGFTPAQLANFISVAVEKHCPNVTAALLEYKNTHFAGIDPMAEFTLDW